MDKKPTNTSPQNKNTKPLQNDDANKPDLVSHYQARWAKIHDDTIRQIERVKGEENGDINMNDGRGRWWDQERK